MNGRPTAQQRATVARRLDYAMKDAELATAHPNRDLTDAMDRLRDAVDTARDALTSL